MKQLEIKSTAQQVGIAGDTVIITAMQPFQYGYGTTAPSTWSTSTTGERTGPFVSDATSQYPLWVKAVGLDSIKVTLDVRHPINKSNLVYDMSSFDDELLLSGKLNGLQATAAEIDGVVNQSQTAVLIGDSITAANYSNVTGYLDYRSGGYFSWVQALSGHAFNVLNFAGISGQTSTQILARFDADVIAYKPDYCFLLMGMNDSGAGTTDLKNNFISAYQKCKSSGIMLVILTMTSTTSDSGKNAQAILVNAWLQEYFASVSGVLVVDTASATRDPLSATAALASNMSYDGIHPSSNGAYLMGKKVYNALKNSILENYKYKPCSAYDSKVSNSLSKNLMKYPMFSGTVTSGLHDLTNIAATTNASQTPTVVSSLDGIGKSQVFTITATAAAAVHGGNLIVDFLTDASYKPTSGKKFFATCEVEVDEGAVNFALVTLAVNRDFSEIKGYDLRNVNTPIHPLEVPKGGLKLTLRTPVTTLSADCTNKMATRFYVLFAGAGSAVVRVSKIALVEVD